MAIGGSNENHRVCNADGAGKAYQQKLLNLFLLGLISSSPATCIYSEFEVQQWKKDLSLNIDRTGACRVGQETREKLMGDVG